MKVVKQIWYYLRWLLLPLALLYGLVTWFYHQLYKWEFLRSVRFDIPVIAVGNLSVGGTGKTMLVEYLIERFGDQFAIGVLSRGYKRKTGGYRTVSVKDSAHEAGDEPAQLKKKHQQTPIAVSSNRSFAIPQLLGDYPQTEVVLLDDAFQHRPVDPGLSILLTSYQDLFTRDFLLPVGRLREWWWGYKRADIIIVTKCPADLPEAEKKQLRTEIGPQSYQSLYFSTLEYGSPYPLINEIPDPIKPGKTSVVLLTGIAQPGGMREYVKEQFRLVSTHSFPDHYNYVTEDLWQVKEVFNRVEHSPKIVLTTEKDAIRLMPHADWLRQSRVPVYCLPVKMRVLGKDEGSFHRAIKKFVMSYR